VDDLVDWFTRQEAPEWAVQNLQTEYALQRPHRLDRDSSKAADKKTNEWESANPRTGTQTASTWSQRRASTWDATYDDAYARLSAAYAPTMPSTVARTFAVCLRMISEQNRQFPDVDTRDMFLIPISTPTGIGTLGSFMGPWGVSSIDARCLRNPAYHADRLQQMTRSVQQQIEDATRQALTSISDAAYREARSLDRSSTPTAPDHSALMRAQADADAARAEEQQHRRDATTMHRAHMAANFLDAFFGRR